MSLEAEDLKIEYLPIDKPIPYARNMNDHSEEHVAEIAASIKEFGWTSAILIDKDNSIAAGHGRLLAARKLGLKRVPCIRRDHWTPAQVRAYRILDNRLPKNADVNDEMLKLELTDLKTEGFELQMLGFGADELNEILAEEGEGTPEVNGEIPWGDEIGPKDNYIVIKCKDDEQFERLSNRLGVPGRVRNNVSASNHPDFEVVGRGRIIGADHLEAELGE